MGLFLPFVELVLIGMVAKTAAHVPFHLSRWYMTNNEDHITLVFGFFQLIMEPYELTSRILFVSSDPLSLLV
jgi:hypothetical protein